MSTFLLSTLCATAGTFAAAFPATAGAHPYVHADLPALEYFYDEEALPSIVAPPPKVVLKNNDNGKCEQKKTRLSQLTLLEALFIIRLYLFRASSRSQPARRTALGPSLLALRGNWRTCRRVVAVAERRRRTLRGRRGAAVARL